MTKVLYPGSFDPITKGHMDIINQATQLFDEVVIAILVNPAKKNVFFTPKERLEMIRELYKEYNNVKVVEGSGASTDLAILHECKAIVRGLRSVTDFEYELQLAQINNDISDNKVKTICLFSDSNLQNISSSAVKEIFNLDKDIAKYVDPLVKEKMLIKRSLTNCGS